MGQPDHAPRMSKRAFLLGAAAGGAGGTAAGRWLVPRLPDPPPPPPEPEPEPKHQKSYSQCGEDLIAWYMLRELNVTRPTYLDIGAHHPTEINNTYFFYTLGFRGVLIEPNVDLIPLLKRVRPDDTVLNVGIGPVTTEADYYRVTDPSWNTFDKATAEHYERVTKGQIKLVEVVKVPLVNINEVLAKHHGGKTPDFVSLDVEGLELDILRSLDWEKHRPKVVCVETLVAGTRRQKLEAANFLVGKGYVERGSTFVNTVFIDGKLIG